MAIVEDRAIVLRSLRHRDTSRIVTLLTAQHGKLTVIAKGARDIKSPFGGALEPLTLVEIVFYLKKQRTLQFLKAAAVEHAYLAILAHPATYHLACGALEFVQRVLSDEDPCPDVFAILAAYLAHCEKDPRPPARGAVFKAFQLQVISSLGYAPQVDSCAHCGRGLQVTRGFGVSEGGLLCPECSGAGQVLPAGARTVALLRALQGGPGADASQSVTLGAEEELAAIVESFLRYHVTGYRGLRSLRGLTQWHHLVGPPSGSP